MTNENYGTPLFGINFLSESIADVKSNISFIEKLDKTYYSDEMQKLCTGIIDQYGLHYKYLIKEIEKI